MRNADAGGTRVEAKPRAKQPQLSPLYEDFERIIRSAIETGRLEAGTVLLEGHVAELLGSSRAPVRQAFAQLAERGLLCRFDGRGYVVGKDPRLVRRTKVGPDVFDLDTSAIKKKFAWQAIYEEVEHSVIQFSAVGEFRVNEVELARYYGVGRTVAHDVLRRIESLGMLTKDERQRWVTVELSEERIGHLYELRRCLEPLALARAIPHLERDLVEKYRNRSRQYLAIYPDVDPAYMDKLELDLHKRCLERCPNKDILASLRRTRCILTLSKHVLGSEVSLPEQDPFLSDHFQILDAILTQPADRAADLMRAHLARSEPKVVARLYQFRANASLPECPYIA